MVHKNGNRGFHLIVYMDKIPCPHFCISIIYQIITLKKITEINSSIVVHDHILGNLSLRFLQMATIIIEIQYEKTKSIHQSMWFGFKPSWFGFDQYINTKLCWFGFNRHIKQLVWFQTKSLRQPIPLVWLHRYISMHS